MADKKSIDELDEEMAKLEEEIRRLEEGDIPEDELEEEEESRSLKDRLPFGGSKDAEEAVEEEPPEPEVPEEESSEGALGKLMGRFRSEDEPEDEADVPPGEPDQPSETSQPAEADDAEATDEPEEADEEPEEEGGGRFAGLVSRFGRSEDDEADEAETEPDAVGEADTETDAETPSDEAPEPLDATIEHEAEPEETPESAPELAGLPEPEQRRRDRSVAWERTPDGGWRRRDEEEIQAIEEDLEAEQAPEEDEEDVGRAAALLARFRAGDEADEDDDAEAEDEAAHAVATEDTIDEPPEEEEEEDRSKLVVVAWILLGIVAIALILALAAALLGGGGASAPTAEVTASAVTTEDGAFVALTGSSITLDAGSTTGSVDRFVWDFGDGGSETTTGPTVSYTYSERGTYTVTLTAEGEGGSSEATLEVLAIQAPQAQPQVLLDGSPVAEPGSTGNNVFVGQTVQLDGSDSTGDPENPIETFSWDVDDDGSEDTTGETAETSFAEVGFYPVTLTVTDPFGNEGSAVRAVTVGSQTLFEDTVGSSTIAQTASNDHPLPVPEGRAGSMPVSINAVLTYTNPDGGVEADLDLSLIDPNGTFHNGTDDDGQGEETVSLSGGDVLAGDWTVRVTNDAMSLGGVNEVDYEVVVEVLYGEP